MPMATGISSFLSEHRIPYEVFWHAYADTSLQAAHQAGLPGRQVVKAVVIDAGGELLMVLVPSNRKIDLDAVADYLGCDVQLADPSRFDFLFADCEPGCVPVTGAAYGLKTLLDEELARAGDLYFSAGDKEEMVHVKGKVFRQAIGAVHIGELTVPQSAPAAMPFY